MRRAGWDVLYFNYRGSWGTPGDFSFTHSIEDTRAAIAYLRQPEVARSLRLDPNRIVLIGHSMGGFMTVEAAGADPAIKAFATISAADMSGRMQAMLAMEKRSDAIAAMAHGLAMPSGARNSSSSTSPGWMLGRVFMSFSAFSGSRRSRRQPHRHRSIGSKCAIGC
ncbi:alpha/beta hydrolase [Rhodanobacter lindaniclasticus]